MLATPPSILLPLLRLRRVIAALAFAGLASLASAGPPITGHEAEVKAAALYNVITFTDWPDGAFSSVDAPLIIGVLGQSPVTAPLNDVVARETWRGRLLKLQPVSTPAEAKACHVLFIARSEQGRWRNVSVQLAQLPILTVSDADTFALQGGMVQFAIEQNRLRLIVNLNSTRAAGLSISSKVLRLAQVIDDRTP